MSKRTFALIAASFVALFYGANYTIAKDVMPHYIAPFGFILLRVLGLTVLLWILGLFGPKETIARKDFLRITVAAFFGIALNMLCFFVGLNLTTPINSAVIMVTSPMIVLLLSILFLKEKMTRNKILGIVIGLLGAVLIVLYGKGNEITATNPVLGNFLIFVNAVSYACYIIVIRKTAQKYHPFTFMKWLATIGLVMVLPFGYQEVMDMPIETIPIHGYLKIGYVIVFATFGTYALNIFAIKTLRPTTVAIFIYLQPLLATSFAIGLGSDTLDLIKIVAALLICTGVYLASKTSTPKTDIHADS